MALVDNKIKVQQLIDGINALPEAGSGGGSVETCNVSITSTSYQMGYGSVVRYKSNLTGVMCYSEESGFQGATYLGTLSSSDPVTYTFEANKNDTIAISVTSSSSEVTVDDGGVLLGSISPSDTLYLIRIVSDCSISVS